MTTTRAGLPDDFQSPLDMFYHWEATRADQPWLKQFVDGQWQEYSWADIGRQSRKIAAALRDMGLKHEDKVGIYAANSAAWMAADLACMMSGCVTVPIYTTMSPSKVKYVAEHSDMKAVFSDNSMPIATLRDQLVKGTRIITMPGADKEGADLHWNDAVQQYVPLDGNPQRALDDVWTIVYTSGTTGMPKGVMHSFSSLPFSGSWLPSITSVTPESRLFSYLPMAHAAERALVQLNSLYSGALIAFNQSKETFVSDLLEVKPTFFFAVPRIWTNLKKGILQQLGVDAWAQIQNDPVFAKEKGAQVLVGMGLGEVTYAFSGSAPISTADIEAWQSLGMPLYEGYGQSEIMSGTINTVESNRLGTVGKLMDENYTKIRIADDGEIQLKSPGAMLGYYKDAEKTAETMPQGWVCTGDKGVIEDGFVRITGRVKEIFKTTKGKYVAPAPIENEFSRCQHIEQLCLVGNGLPQTIMLMTLTDSSVTLDKDKVAVDLEATRQAVNANLEAHERMSHVLVCNEPWTMENGLLTHTLKILRDDVETHNNAAILACADQNSQTVYWG